MNSTEKNSPIPKFSIKNSFIIFLAGIVGGLVLPYCFYLLNWDSKIAVMLFLPALISLAIAYGQCFIETREGIGSRFYRTLIIAFVVLETVSYLWLFKGFIF